MHLVMLDICVWLDMSSQKAELPMLTALEHLVQDDTIKILLPDLVRMEYERNKDPNTHQASDSFKASQIGHINSRVFTVIQFVPQEDGHTTVQQAAWNRISQAGAQMMNSGVMNHCALS